MALECGAADGGSSGGSGNRHGEKLGLLHRAGEELAERCPEIEYLYRSGTSQREIAVQRSVQVVLDQCGVTSQRIRETAIGFALGILIPSRPERIVKQ